MITPSGRPAWERSNTHVEYGGDVNKRNFLSQGVIDSQTDIGADQFSRMVADMEAVARTAPFAIITYKNNDASPAAPTILSVFGMIGVRTVSYAGDAAPAGFPSAARNSTGSVIFTFASAYNDAYGVSGAFSLSQCIPSPVGASYFAPVYVIIPTTQLLLACFDGTGAAIGDKTVSFMVW